MFLSDSTTCLTGIALKRSHFSIYEDFLEAISFADQYHNFVFIDYEGIQNLLDPTQLETIIEQVHHNLVFTIAVRGCEFHFQRKFLLENYIRLTRKYSNLLFCVVAGHPAYSSIETRLPVIKAFHNVFTRIRSKQSSLLFLGIENVTSDLVNILKQEYYPIMPLILHGDPRVICTTKILPPFAVYSPLAHSVPDEVAIKSLLGYLLRRKITQEALKKKGFCFLTPPMNKQLFNELIPEIQSILWSSFDRFVLTSQNIRNRTETFIQNGVQLIVGNPAIPGQLFELIRSFKTIIGENSSDWLESSEISNPLTGDKPPLKIMHSTQKPINF
ncbi:MAG: hypothetical protein ACFFB5_14910 [Promethearchaeota archaeon]